MTKRKIESQMGSLTLDHKKSRIDQISLHAGLKALKEGYNFALDLIQIRGLHMKL
jgi:hypothetical protein